MGGLSRWEVFIIIAYIVMQIIGWIHLVVDAVNSLIECKKCVRRESCEFLIFSEHCLKRHCMNEEEREAVWEKINELD